MSMVERAGGPGNLDRTLDIKAVDVNPGKN